MSCCCPNICNCNPCQTTTTTTSTTTTTTLCPDAIFCDAIYDLNCFIYSGCNDDCPQISTGDSLVQVFANILEMIEYQCGGIPSGTTTTTTTEGPIPPELVAICLTYSSVGGCAASCPLECTDFYADATCVNYINTNAAPQPLGCILYSDALGTTPALDGWYSRPGGLCYILGSHSNSGIITGISLCP